MTAESVAARTFAAERVRVLGDILRAMPGHQPPSSARRGRPAEWHEAELPDLLLPRPARGAARRTGAGRAAVSGSRPPRSAEPDRRENAGRCLCRAARRAAQRPASRSRSCASAATGCRTPATSRRCYFNYHLAAALAELGDAEAALAAADKAIEQTAASDRLTVRLQKLYVLRLLGKWDDAIALGKKLLDEFDVPADRLRIRYALAGAYWGAKKRDEAEAELRPILDADPDYAAAANDLGFHLADQGRNLDEAERLVRTAIAADRIDRKKAGNAELDNAAYLDSLGWVLFRRGKLAGSAQWNWSAPRRSTPARSTRWCGTTWATCCSGSARSRRRRRRGRRRGDSTRTNRAARRRPPRRTARRVEAEAASWPP